MDNSGRKLDERHKPMYLRSSVNSKQDRYKENSVKAKHEHIVENEGLEEFLQPLKFPATTATRLTSLQNGARRKEQNDHFKCEKKRNQPL